MMSEKKRYATVETWADYFTTSEGVQVHPGLLRKRVREAGHSGETGRSNTGRLFKNAYFSESAVRSALNDLLDPSLYLEDENGNIVVDGVTHVNINNFCLRHEAAPSLMRTAVDELKPTSIRGRSKTKITDYYPEQALLDIWRDYTKLPEVNNQGNIEIEGDSYSTVYALSQELKCSENAVRTAITRGKLEAVVGRDQQNVKRLYFPITQIRGHIDSNRALPRTDSDGFAEIDGKRVASLATWVKKFAVEIDQRTIRKRLDAMGIQGGNAIDQTNVPREGIYFSEEDFLQSIEQYEETMRVDESGERLVNDRKFMSTTAFCSQTGLSRITVVKHLDPEQDEAVKVRNSQGHWVSLYTEDLLRDRFAKHIERQAYPKVDNSGFIYFDGVRYASISQWRKLLGIQLDARMVKRRLDVADIQGKSGRLSHGRLLQNGFYSETDIRNALNNPDEK